MRVKVINGPDGCGGKTYDGLLGMMQVFKAQLKCYVREGQNQDQLHADIEGYDMVIESDSENNAKKFLEIKSLSRCGKFNRSFSSNVEIVDYMKLTGEWEG